MSTPFFMTMAGSRPLPSSGSGCHMDSLLARLLLADKLALLGEEQMQTHALHTLRISDGLPGTCTW
jgi:hypothetical protein